MRHLRKVMAVLIVALMLTGCGEKQPPADVSSPVSGGSAAASGEVVPVPSVSAGLPAASTGESVEEEKQTLTLPCELQDGSLEVTSLFQYSGINPDCGDEMGENIGSLAVTNRSGRHLIRAEITAQLAGGTELNFLAQEIPAGEAVWLFDVNNTPMTDGDSCEVLICDARFSDDPSFPSGVNIVTAETTVTVLNQSGAVLDGLSASCHCRFDDVLFGGTAYVYPLDAIPSGGSVQFQSEECYLGEAAVVRIGPQR